MPKTYIAVKHQLLLDMLVFLDEHCSPSYQASTESLGAVRFHKLLNELKRELA